MNLKTQKEHWSKIIWQQPLPADTMLLVTKNMSSFQHPLILLQIGESLVSSMCNVLFVISY